MADDEAKIVMFCANEWVGANRDLCHLQIKPESFCFRTSNLICYLLVLFFSWSTVRVPVQFFRCCHCCCCCRMREKKHFLPSLAWTSSFIIHRSNTCTFTLVRPDSCATTSTVAMWSLFSTQAQRKQRDKPKRANGKKCNDQKTNTLLNLIEFPFADAHVDISRGHRIERALFVPVCDAMPAHNQFHHSFERILFTIMEMNGEYSEYPWFV